MAFTYDVLVGIASELIATAMISLGKLLFKADEGSAAADFAAELRNIDSLSAVLQRGLQSASQSLTGTLEVKSFLTSAEAESVVRQMFGLISQRHLFKDEGSEADWRLGRSDSFEVLRKQLGTVFEAHFRRAVGSDDIATRQSAEVLFDALLLGCERSLQLAAERGSLGAHDARSTLRYRRLLDEISTLSDQLTLLASDLPTQQEVDSFELEFRSQAEYRHGSVRPPLVSAQFDLPIGSAYVKPHLVRLSPVRSYREFYWQTWRSRIDDDSVAPYDEFVARIHRTVVLGDPGAGKSTLAARLCWELAASRDVRVICGRRVVPIVIAVREYAVHRASLHISIVEFCERLSKTSYMVDPPSKIFELLLSSGRLFVVFDGLDELVDGSVREEIRDEIRAFCRRWPSAPVLVTSRHAGYRETPLNTIGAGGVRGNQFDEFVLSEFEDSQACEYVRHWFSAVEMPSIGTDEKVIRFMDETADVADIRSNPFMLALMCSLYRDSGYIPRNRPDVYERCTRYLFEELDKERRIYQPPPLAAHSRLMVMMLADWIFRDENLQAGVPETRLQERLADYYALHAGCDRNEAREFAKQFIEFSEGRAWVFTDVGTNAEGERLFQFTHRTFLEYFTAAHLVRTSSDVTAVIAEIVGGVGTGSWDVVGLLAAQILNKSSAANGTALLMAALDAVQVLNRNTTPVAPFRRRALIAYVSRGLAFIAPEPRAAETVGRVIIHEVLAGWNAERSWGGQLMDPRGAVAALLQCAKENRSAVARAIVDTCDRVIASGTAQGAYPTLEFVLSLSTFARGGVSSQTTLVELRTYWDEVSMAMMARHATTFRRLSGRSAIQDPRTLDEARSAAFASSNWFNFPVVDKRRDGRGSAAVPNHRSSMWQFAYVES